MGRKLKPLTERSNNLFHFHVPLEEPLSFGVMEKAYIIIKREALSFDDLCFSAIDEYVKRHYDGNFQTILGSYEPGGVKSEGQQEQALIRYYEARHKDGYKVNYNDLIERLRESLEYSGTQLVNTAQRIAKTLHEKGMEVIQ